MGGEADASAAGDPQRLKRIGAAAYDYENDARWAGYWSNVLVPPHLASRPDVVDHFKRKIYQRYIDPGLVVEPMSSLTSTQSTRPAARSSSTPSGTGCCQSWNASYCTQPYLKKYLEDPCLWVETNNTTLSLLCSNAEITLGFLMIISLFSSRRNIVQTFMYFHLLKLMYHAPVTSGYHQSIWSRLGRTVNPYIYRYTPILNTPISAVQRWWLR